MPLTYQEFIQKREDILNYQEYAQIVNPTLKYFGAAMRAAADKLAPQNRRLADAFRRMGDDMTYITREDPEGLDSASVAMALSGVNNLYAFLDESTGGVTNRQRLEEALAENPQLKNSYFTTDERRNAPFQEQLDALGDFFIISQRAMNAEADRIDREKILQAADMRRQMAEQRINARLQQVPENQRDALRETLWAEFEADEQIIAEGARYAEEQERARQLREQEEKERQEREDRERQERERLEREERERREREEQERLERERLAREERERQKQELRQQLTDLRAQQGPFAMPRNYDYRDAAVHFTLGLQNGNPEDSPVVKTAEKIHARRQAMEEEVGGIIAEVDRRFPPDGSNDGYETLRKVPDRREILIRNYGSKLNENLEQMPGDGEEQEINLLAKMQEERLVRETRRSDLLENFPERKELNAQLEPFLVKARREILKERLGDDLELRMRQTETQMTATALLSKVLLNPAQKELLDGILEKTFGAELEQKLAKYQGPTAKHDLFRKEIYEPALREPEKWKALCAAIDFPIQLGRVKIPDMEFLTKAVRGTVKQEAVEAELFKTLAEMHPELALEDKAQEKAEEALYASLHPKAPKLDGSKLLSDWARQEELKVALGDKQKELDKLRKLDEAADGLKKACLDAAKNKEKPGVYGEKLADASRQMKATMVGLYELHQNDPEKFKELAGDLDEEWVNMDLLGSKEIREKHNIPEQFLLQDPWPKEKPVWPFKDKGAGEKLKEVPKAEYKFHAFDSKLPAEVWTDEELGDDVTIGNYSEVGDLEDILNPKLDPVSKYMNEQYDKLAKLHYPGEVADCLSRIMAADSLMLRGENEATEQEIEALARKLRTDGSLEKVAKSVDPKIFATTKRPDLIFKCVEKVKSFEENAAEYRRKNMQKLQEETGPAVDAMLATKKGESFLFGIPRFLTGNSTRYENALAAMQNVQKAKPLKQDYLDTQIDTVKRYISDKKEKRIRDFGNVRWNQCMTFLKYAMPRKDFENYCAQVNQAREANSPADEDYVSPEMFGKPQTVSELREEILDRVRAGEGTLHDFAVLSAMKSMELAPEAQVDVPALLTETHKLEYDNDFRTVIQHGSAAMKQSMAEKDGGLPLTHYAEYAKQFKNGVFSFKASSEEPEGLEKEMLEVSKAKGLEEELNHIATEGAGVENFRKVRMRKMDPQRPAREEGEVRKQEEPKKEEEEVEIILN